MDRLKISGRLGLRYRDTLPEVAELAPHVVLNGQPPESIGNLRWLRLPQPMVYGPEPFDDLMLTQLWKGWSDQCMKLRCEPVK